MDPCLRIEVGNISSYLRSETDGLDEIYDGLQKILSYRVQGCEFTPNYNEIDKRTMKRKWDGRERLCWKQKGAIRFPTGLFSKVRVYLNENEIEYKVSDTRIKCKRHFDYKLKSPIKFRPYQEDSIEKSIKSQRGVVKVATGGGKTFIAAGIFQRLGLKKMVFFAMSGDLILQAKDEIEKCLELNGEGVEVGVIGGGMCDIRDINACTIQTACRAFGVTYQKSEEGDEGEVESQEVANRREEIRNFLLECEAVVFDEVQHAACCSVKAIMEKCSKAQYRLGLSVFPDSVVEVKGEGCENGESISIEDLWGRMSDDHQWRLDGDYQIIDVDGLSSRGWGGGQFKWKHVRKVIRHKGIKKNFRVEFSGGYVKMTEDHSIFRSKNNILEECTPKDLELGDILLSDGGDDLSYVRRKVLSVEEIDESPEWVYDLEMDGHPSFVANGVLVHNSASPWRDDKADLFIDAYFGRRVVDISASKLIKAGFLVKPTIHFVKMDTDLAAYSSYPTVYRRFITENEVRNDFIVRKAAENLAEGRSVLILVKQIRHGKLIQGMLENSVMLSGKDSIKKRKKVLDDFRSGKVKTIIASSIFDQGIDVKRVSCLILAGSGKSSTRALQRIGRVLRPLEGAKTDAVIYDFMDTAKYLSTHARDRLKIYKTEPEFNIINDDMGRFYR